MIFSDVRLAAQVIDDSALAVVIEEKINAHRPKSGRPRELSVRTLLIALLLLSETGTMHLSRVPALLNSLDKKTKTSLGITRKAGVTRRQVERLYNVIAAAFDSHGIESFDEFCDTLLVATLDKSSANTSSIAIDGTSIDSWGTRRRVYDANGVMSYRSSDPDAAWRAKSKDNPWKRPVFGYDLTVAVTVADINGPDVALGARSMRFRAANQHVMASARAVVKEVARQQGVLGDVLMDREYTMKSDGSDLILPIRALGGEPVFQLTKTQSGVVGTTHGALIIDGQPFSPSCPTGLRKLIAPAVNAPHAVIAQYKADVAARSKYALVKHGSRKANGSQVYQCPASVGNLKCALVASSMKLPATVLPAVLAPKTAAANSVCSKRYTTFQATDLPLSQRDLYGSEEWFKSSARRNRIEGLFGNLKNEATENVKRGTIRVRGLIKMGILVAFGVASANLRLQKSFKKRSTTPVKPKRGRPKKPGVAAYAQVFASDANSNAPPQVA